MTDPTQAYDLGAIRQLLRSAFTPEDLRRFCLDRPLFEPVVADFGPKYNLNDMVDEVIDFCRTRALFDEFLGAVREARPKQAARFLSQVRGVAPAQPSLREEDARAVRQLYGQILEVAAKLRAWAYRDMPIGLAPEQVDRSEVLDQVRSLNLLARKARLYLSSGTTAVLDRALEHIGAVAGRLEYRDITPDEDEQWVAHTAAIDLVSESIPAAIEELERELRQILGLT